jgi:CheY-like chemotaxis protein
MPRLNGVDVLRRIGASVRTKGLPVLLLAEKDQLNLLDGHGLVPDGYVRKPLDSTQLSDVKRQLGMQRKVESDV